MSNACFQIISTSPIYKTWEGKKYYLLTVNLNYKKIEKPSNLNNANIKKKTNKRTKKKENKTKGEGIKNYWNCRRKIERNIYRFI